MDNFNELINKYTKNKPGRNFNVFVGEENTQISYSLNKNKYWGLTPEISEQEIQKLLTSEISPLDSQYTLNCYYEKLTKENKWMWDHTSAIAERAIFKRILLAFSQHYYCYYLLDEASEHILKQVWAETKIKEDKKNNKYFDEIDINVALKELNEKVDTINICDENNLNSTLRKINGRIPKRYLHALRTKNCTYLVKELNGVKYIKIGENLNGKRIANLYKDKEVKECFKPVAPTFYSGTLARINGIIREESESHINYIFCLSKITYATHLGLKDPRMNKNKLFFNKEERAALFALDKKEVILQNNLLKEIQKCEGNATIIQYFNAYLKESIYTHGLNVSGNIITSDNKLVFTKRGKDTWDSATLYCSSNGVCEVYDNKVSFYKQVPKHEQPQINITKGNFNSELTRETQAELGIIVEPDNWKFYGFSIMGYNDNNKYHNFPLHINILGWAKVIETVNEIRKKSITATEALENECINELKRTSTDLETFLKELNKKYPNAHTIFTLMATLYQI